MIREGALIKRTSVHNRGGTGVMSCYPMATSAAVLSTIGGATLIHVPQKGHASASVLSRPADRMVASGTQPRIVEARRSASRSMIRGGALLRKGVAQSRGSTCVMSCYQMAVYAAVPGIIGKTTQAQLSELEWGFDGEVMIVSWVQ